MFRLFCVDQLKEILTYITLFGGIPRYLKQIDQSYSLTRNLDMHCFEKDGFFVEEVNRVFYSQFKEAQVSRRIIVLLSKQNLSLNEISQKLKMSSGGGLKSYLENLEMSLFIKSYIPLNGKSAKQKKYKLFDEYLFAKLNTVRILLEQRLFQSLKKKLKTSKKLLFT